MAGQPTAELEIQARLVASVFTKFLLLVARFENSRNVEMTVAG
jgi:hypothetical protein